MAKYRETRNLQSSIIDYLKDKSDDDWKSIPVEMYLTFKDVKIPSITVAVTDTDIHKREIGSGKNLKFPVVTIRIFSNSEGLRMDLANWIESELEHNIPYYKYQIEDGRIVAKELSGNIAIYGKIKSEKELANSDPEILAVEDRYRHRIEFSVFVGKS